MRMIDSRSPFPAQLTSRPEEVRHCRWDGGSFTTAYRPPTVIVEGEIRSSNHLVMVTLQGGARRHEIVADGGHRFDGPDRPGSVSFLPASCTRKLRLHGVGWRWASIALAPGSDPAVAVLDRLGPLSGVDDPFVHSMLAEFDRLHAIDNGFDALWRGSMVRALAVHLFARYGSRTAVAPTRREATLAPWQLRLVNEFINANLSGEIRIEDLAALCRLSEGYFHRAFRAATGVTPLQHVNRRRVEAARDLLATSELTIATVAFKVGFLSASHFARVFHAATGCSPSRYRRTKGL